MKFVNSITLNTAVYRNKNGLDDTTRLEVVNLANVPWKDNSMVNAFINDDGLTTVSNFNASVTNMSGAFNNCSSLTTVGTLPTGVQDLSQTFYNCSSLVDAPVIPNSVVDMHETFENCSLLTTISSLSGCNHLTSLPQTFKNCSSLVSAPVLPSSIEHMFGTFENCTSLTDAPTIPSATTALDNTFKNCSSLTDAPTIPILANSLANTFNGCSDLVNITEISTSVTNMSGTFDGCILLSGSIKILSTEITSATDCFNNTSANKDVYIPFTYENGVNTQTYETFKLIYSSDPSNRINGVLLKDANVDIPFETDYDYIDLGNGNYELTNYKGNETNITTPNV